MWGSRTKLQKLWPKKVQICQQLVANETQDFWCQDFKFFHPVVRIFIKWYYLLLLYSSFTINVWIFGLLPTLSERKVWFWAMRCFQYSIDCGSYHIRIIWILTKNKYCRPYMMELIVRTGFQSSLENIKNSFRCTWTETSHTMSNLSSVSLFNKFYL